MIDVALRDSLAAFDDAALATLANAGLVRRAHRDVAEDKVRLVSVEGGRAKVEADGQVVTLDARGPRAADCACRSAAICRHRIAAVLYLQAAETDPEAQVSDEIDAAADPAEIVVALDIALLERWSGKASWRGALELAATVTSVEPSANAIAVRFETLEGAVRILRGQGFDGIVSKAAKAQAKAYHAAAVLAARRHFGTALPQIEEVDDADPVPPEIDRAFLDRIDRALGEVASQGFNLAPVPLEESLFELSVSSRADSLPRLAALLRGIAAQLRLRRQRMISFDPDRMLETTATAFALVRALQTGTGDRLVALAGKVRRDFAPAAPLELVGCGGERWWTDTGARGVTAWFIEPATGRWLSTTLARGPGQDPTFNPGDAWRVQAMWQAEPLAILAHSRISLEGSRISDDGRLSAPASARATVTERSVMPASSWPGIVHRWAELRETYLREVGIGLDPANVATACLLSPNGAATPFFDELAQQLVWPVRDADGAWLALTLAHEESVSSAISALETHVRGDWHGAILVRLSRAGERLEVRPITLFGAGPAIDLSLWQSHSSQYRARPGRSTRDWLTRLRSRRVRPFARLPRGATDAALAAAWRQVLDHLEMGVLTAIPKDDLARHADRLESHGLPTLATIMRDASNAPHLLAVAYALMIARQQRCQVPMLTIRGDPG